MLIKQALKRSIGTESCAIRQQALRVGWGVSSTIATWLKNNKI